MRDDHGISVRMVDRQRFFRTAPGPIAGAVAQLLLLVALVQTVGVSAAGWVVGAVVALVLDATLARALWRNPAATLNLASWVTLARATLTIGVGALAVSSFARALPVATFVSLASVALALDFVDGWVARRTGSSALGARLDGEIDALLILALSIEVARSVGVWVLAIGAARYLFYAAGWSLRWLRASLPRRDWRKSVTAAQGIGLVIAAAHVLPLVAAQVVVAVALALLTESFGRDTWWLWRHRHAAGAQARGRTRDPRLTAALSLLAFVVVWAALVTPTKPWLLTPGAFVRLPLEGIVVVVLAVVLPDRVRRVLPWLVGPALGLLVLVKVLDIGFFTAFDRPFNPVDDWSFLSFGVETTRETFGRTVADLTIVAAVLIVAVALALPTLAAIRLSRVAARHRRVSLGASAALAGAWIVFWAAGVQVVSGARIASASGADLAVQEVRAVQVDLRDHSVFDRLLRKDDFRDKTGGQLVGALRGKDVLLVFVESYGRLAVQGSPFSPAVDAVLATGEAQLADAGFSAESGWLTSSTFGGGSWWAHSTLQSGTWIDTQGRYDALVKSHRLTLASAFALGGWRTVAEDPSNSRAWPEGRAFYHFDQVYNRHNLGYHGPTYGFSTMPDEYTLLSLQRLELAKPRTRNIFAEVDLTSSHTPWTRIPPFIPWNEVGDGSIYNRLPIDRSGLNDPEKGYSTSTEYSLRTLFSFVAHSTDKNLVLIVLGDHQPSRVDPGQPGHSVPISIVAHDPAVLKRISSWGWVDGLQPDARAPIWPMSAFRNRFFAAFGA